MAEVINCFICLELNTKKVKNYLLNEKNIKISHRLINNIYKEWRNIIYKYQPRLLCTING